MTALLIAIMALILAITFGVLLASEWLERLIGVQGEAVFGRLLGVLLAALAVQYVADGILSLVPK
jgi:multiple antibiotic resistance protein